MRIMFNSSNFTGGKVDKILITGGMARWKQLVQWVSESVQWIAEVIVYPGGKYVAQHSELTFCRK